MVGECIIDILVWVSTGWVSKESFLFGPSGSLLTFSQVFRPVRKVGNVVPNFELNPFTIGLFEVRCSTCPPDKGISLLNTFSHR
jgi:hypothetical protein